MTMSQRERERERDKILFTINRNQKRVNNIYFACLLCFDNISLSLSLSI